MTVPKPRAAVLTALKAVAPENYYTVIETRCGYSWTCVHPACEHDPRGGYGCRFPSAAAAERAAVRHVIGHGAS